jgi:cysteinyl-tRNA synthetase
MAESKELAVAARALAQKAYKKDKKKRAKVNQAEKKRGEEQGLGLENKQAEKPTPTNWHRVVREDGCAKATHRLVDDDNINELLEKRSKAKAEKNYTVSDEVTDTLIAMEIVYNDEKKEWHTRLLSTVGQKAKKEEAKKRAIENKAEPGEPAAKKTKQ